MDAANILNLIPKIRKLSSSSLYPRLVTFNATLDYYGKWIAAAIVGAVMVWRADSRGLWAAMGALVNWGLSVTLKIIINQPRPFPAKKSDPGMPSSHSQSLFYAFTYLSSQVFESLGMNYLAFGLGGLSIYFSFYLSWLRVTQRYHTCNQVVVGAFLGTLFCVVWLSAWTFLVSQAFHSFFWVRVLVVLGAVAFWMVLLVITKATFRRKTKTIIG